MKKRGRGRGWRKERKCNNLSTPLISVLILVRIGIENASRIKGGRKRIKMTRKRRRRSKRMINLPHEWNARISL